MRRRLIAGAVGGDVGPVAGQHPQFGDQRVVEPKFTQVSAHAALVGDDRRAFGVGLALAAVAIGRAVHSHTRQVPDTLAPAE